MRRKSPRRDVGKERFWRRVVREQAKSGLTIRDYCSREGLSEPSFYAWRRELDRRREQGSKRKPKMPRRTAGPKETGHTAHPKAAEKTGRPAKPNTKSAAKAKATFVPIAVAGQSISQLHLSAIELLLPSGAVLRLPAETEASTLATLVADLEQRLC
jgi:hypothetical protein